MRTVVVDSQILSTFQECEEKYRLTFIENIRPAWPADPLTKGQVLHSGLEAYYKHLKKGLETEQTRNLIHNQGVELAIEAANFEAARNGIDFALSEEVITVMGEYLYFWKDDDIVPIAIEEPFLINLYEDEELRILYAGKIDLVATASRYQWKPTPFDNKSQGRRNTPSGRSNQFFGYTTVLDSNVLIVNTIGFQKSLTPAEKFKRHPLSYPVEYRRHWAENTVKTVFRLVRALDTNTFEENITSCDKYSGCVMKKICESITPEAKEWKIQQEYIIGEPWDVTKLLSLKNESKDGDGKETVTDLTSGDSIRHIGSNDTNV
jgi:hypothetical protein